MTGIGTYILTILGVFAWGLMPAWYVGLYDDGHISRTYAMILLAGWITGTLYVFVSML